METEKKSFHLEAIERVINTDNNSQHLKHAQRTLQANKEFFSSNSTTLNSFPLFLLNTWVFHAAQPTDYGNHPAFPALP